jgi:uncharacterized SAM-binding protein YcdF (DUF218 family)
MVKKRIAKGLLLIFFILLVTVALLASRIYTYRNAGSDGPADAAIVLGAAVWGTQVSPVFKERINHGIDLYQNGRVRKLIFTGGQGNSNEPTESSAARRYAMQQGVPAGDILIEEKSHTTYENILYAKQIADANGLRKVLIVSDPLHMKRSVVMARDVGLVADPSPTRSSRYQGLGSQAQMLAHETYYYIGYLLRRTLLDRGARVNAPAAGITPVFQVQRAHIELKTPFVGFAF